MKIIEKIIKFLRFGDWKYLSILIIINLFSYLYRIFTYKTITDFIGKFAFTNLKYVNNFLISFFLELFMIHGFYYFTEYILEKEVIDKIHGVFKKIITRILNYRIQFFKENSNGKLNQIWFYLNNIETLSKKFILELPKISLYIMYYIYLISSLSRKAILVIIPINLFILRLLHVYSKKEYGYKQKMIKYDLLSKTRFMESISNIEHVKLNNMQEYENNMIMNSYNTYNELKTDSLKLSNYIKYVYEIFSDILMLIVYSLGMTYIFNGSINQVELMYIGIHTTNFYYKLIQLKNIYNYYKKISPKIAMINDILFHDGIETINDISNKDEDNIEFDGIYFKNISFSYNTNTPILKNLSFGFENRKINVLLGPNGSGKSTIIKLLLRLYELKEESSKNKIYLDKKNIKNISIREIRDKICFVQQEPMIFDSTILDNISYGCKKSSSKLKLLCKLLGLTKWLNDNQYKRTGFRGRHLSGGERKKIQFLNAIYKDSKIIIFDEPSNALDSNAIIWFINLVRKLRDEFQKTIIIITHDLRLKEIADNVINLKEINTC